MRNITTEITVTVQEMGVRTGSWTLGKEGNEMYTKE